MSNPSANWVQQLRDISLFIAITTRWTSNSNPFFCELRSWIVLPKKNQHDTDILLLQQTFFCFSRSFPGHCTIYVPFLKRCIPVRIIIGCSQLDHCSTRAVIWPGAVWRWKDHVLLDLQQCMKYKWQNWCNRTVVTDPWLAKMRSLRRRKCPMIYAEVRWYPLIKGAYFQY